ncbi:amidohydrolase [Gilvimarinus sp. DA14]|uniref:amidohydrolase family protein n=1 Tax=Gilvimarinus sp. DA14 TaxID=2956798 RepID=UPI0020B879EB|nr:amidohydrolase family protein [Gilvimarinus sp. DA14]UTF59155.1 amidohydrolase family protein [Gilvimarinus sp. DA14]
MPDFALVDAHQHAWELANTQWPTPELGEIYRDFSAADYLTASAEAGAVASVLVQSQPHAADTDYLLAEADAYRHVVGVVGWVDLAAADAREQLTLRARHPAFCGVRPMLQALPEDDWILRPECAAGLAALSEHKLCFDALVYPRHLRHIETLALAHPELSIVLDHGAKPDIAGGEWQHWYQLMVRLAALPNVHCKLSGLITEAPAESQLSVVRPYAEAILTLFGPRRVIWGSDWPVLNLASNYREWLVYCRQLVQSFAPGAEKAIFRDNAIALYRLGV